MKTKLIFPIVVGLLCSSSFLSKSLTSSSSANTGLSASNLEVRSLKPLDSYILISQNGINTTPQGSVKITVGTWKDKTVSYGDNDRNKHTKFPNHSQDDLDKAVKSPSNPKEIIFSNSVKTKDTNYGGQLNSEAIKKYEELVKTGIEKGKAVGDKYYHEASFPVGTDIATGKRTSRYRLDSIPNGTHVIPLAFDDKILK